MKPFCSAGQPHTLPIALEEAHAHSGANLGAMFMTPDGAFQDETVGLLPKLKKPVGANQYTAATMLTLEPPSYPTKVSPFEPKLN